MAYTNIIVKAYDLADDLKESTMYKELKRLDKYIKINYKNELKEYHKAFKKFDDIFNNGGRYHPNFKEVSKDYQLKKEVLFNKEEVKAYFKYEKEINEYLKRISDEIFSSVSKHLKKGGICSWI